MRGSSGRNTCCHISYLSGKKWQSCIGFFTQGCKFKAWNLAVTLLWTKHEQASSSRISSELAKPIVYGPYGVMHFINPQIGNALNSVILNFEEWMPGLHFSVLPQVEAQWILHYNTKQQHTSPKAILNN